MKIAEVIQNAVKCYCVMYDEKKRATTHTLEKAMATHCSTLAWRIPWVEEPGGLQSMGSLGVGHD